MDEAECVYDAPASTSASGSSTPTSVPRTKVKLEVGGKLELDVQLCALQPPMDPQTTYPNYTSPKGHAIIFNNRQFWKGGLAERYGTDIDAANLKQLFEKIGYIVQVRRDYEAEDMLLAMYTFCQKPAHQRSDSCVVVVLSHGRDGVVYGADGGKVQLKEFLEMLDGENCPALRGKPKLFLMQACRGRLADDGVHPDADEENDSEQQTSKIPVTADMLLAYSTTPGYVSWRNEQKGSRFIQTVCQVFAKYSHQEHVDDLLTRVNNIVSNVQVCKKRCRRHCGANSQCSGHLQMPEFTSRLRRRWFLFPGLSTHGVARTRAPRAAIQPNADQGPMETNEQPTPSGGQDASQSTSNNQTPTGANKEPRTSKASRNEDVWWMTGDSDGDESNVSDRQGDTPEPRGGEDNDDQPTMTPRPRRKCYTKNFKHLFDTDQDEEVEVHPPSPSYESGGETDNNSHSDSDNQQQRRTRANVNNKKSINRETSHKQYKCTECSYKTNRKWNLKEHQQSVHLNERPFECATCDYTAATMRLLKAHEQTHSDERPFECATCDYTAATMRLLKQHEQTHSDERPFACRYPQCQKRFKTASNRWHHENMHKSGVCPEKTQ